MSTCTMIIALTAALLSQGPVRLELFPQAEPVALKMFPDPEPVTLKMFPDKAPPSVEDPEKHLVPPPIDIEQPPAAPKIPVVWMYSNAGCVHCRVIKAEYRIAMERGELLPYVLEYPDQIPGWVQSLPTFHCQIRGKWVSWDGIKHLSEFTRAYTAAMQKRAPKQEATRLVLTTRELIRQLPPVPHVGFNGDIVYHLREHGWTGSLDGLTYQELDKLHDALHAGVISPNGQVRTESRSRFMHRLQRTRHVATIRPKRFDPFLALTIIGIVLDLSKLFCPNH